MDKKIVTLLASSVLFALPVAALAFNAGALPGTNANIGALIDNVFNLIWPIFMAVAVIMFLIAGFLFLTARGDPAKVKDARNAVIWGSVGVGVGLLAFSIPVMIRLILGV